MSEIPFMLDLLAKSKYFVLADISKWQDKFDFNKSITEIDKAIDGFILRSSYGLVKDQKFEEFFQELEEHPEKLRGVYHYLYSSWDIENQIHTFLDAIEGKDIDFLVLDFERGHNKNTREFALMAVRFMKEVRAAYPDKKIFLYTGKYTYDGWLSPYITEHKGWLYWHAQYIWGDWNPEKFTEIWKTWWSGLISKLTQKPNLPKGKGLLGWEIWQFVGRSFLGKIIGVATRDIDLSITRREHGDFVAFIGRPARWDDIPEPPPVEPPVDCEAEYKRGVSDGISLGQQVMGQSLITHIDRIYVGDRED